MKLRDYQDRYKRLVQLEQEEEMNRHEDEMRSLSASEREEKGRCFTDMILISEKTGMGGENKVIFKKSDSTPLPDSEISTGDLVRISRDKPLDSNNPTGTVWEKRKRKLVVSFDQGIPGWAQSGRLRIDLYVDNVTFQRMLDSLFVLPGLIHEKEPLRNIILDQRTPEDVSRAIEPEWINDGLNIAQKHAVSKALSASNLFLIHGPPGTGKTVTLTEIIAQASQRDQRILATAESNVAVDNLLTNLLEYDVDVVRLGHPARAHPKLRSHTLDFQVENESRFKKSQKKRREALDLIDERREYTTPSGRWRRGMSDEEILSHAERNRGNRGVSPEKIKEMAEFIRMSDEIDRLFDESDALEDEAINAVISDADVVCATNSTSGSQMLSGHDFDLICIDEATQATEPSCLIPITKGKKLVMAGDHKQLPPTVLNDEAKAGGLDKTLFERLMEKWADTISQRLHRQYRMNETIMRFPSRSFYEDELVADSSVRNHTLDDNAGYHPESLNSDIRDFIRSRPTLLWFDTRSLNATERQRDGSTSRFNPIETQLVSKICSDFLEAGLSADQIAVITPYTDQVESISDKLGDCKIEVNSVDGFQGREKDVIIMSFVRSNERNEIGFLYDQRRLNVSLTRARKKLILIGDSSTLNSKLYTNLHNYVSNEGRVAELTNYEIDLQG